MTEREQIFKTIGEAFGTPRESRTPHQKDITRFGVCGAAKKVTTNWQLAQDIMKEVLDDISKQQNWWDIYFKCGFGESGDKFRSEYCLKKAGVL